MYRLTKIHELKDEELTGGPGKLVAVDVPDDTSPTGYTTKYIQASNLAPTVEDTNIGTDDLTSADLIRKYILAGALATNYFSFRNSADTVDMLKVKGDNTITIPTGYLSVGLDYGGPGYGGHRVYIGDSGNGGSIYAPKGGANGSAFKTVLTPSGGSQIKGLDVRSSNATMISKYGSYFKITGSTNENLAIFIDEGDVRLSNTVGTKIGTGTTQKIGFWNTAPIVQPGLMTAADTTPTDGTIGTADTILNNMRIRINELEAALSAAGGGVGLLA